LSFSFVKTIKTKSGIRLNLFLHLALPILHQPLRRYRFHLLLPFVNTEMMQIYLDELSQSLGEKEIILIMDQAGWHKSKALVVPKNVDIWFLPPYSPELNPVERLWKMIKRNTLHNRLYDSLKQLEKAVVEYFDTLNSEVLMKLCTCSYI